MDKNVKEALRAEMPAIVQFVTRIIVSNPELRNSGIRYEGLIFSDGDPIPEIINDIEAFKSFLQPECADIKVCVSDDGQTEVVVCANKKCPSGFHEV